MASCTWLNDILQTEFIVKMAVFWVFAQCSLAIYRLFGGACYLIALMTEAASTSETSVNFYQTTRRNNP
jgi:hypothetical protein